MAWFKFKKNEIRHYLKVLFNIGFSNKNQLNLKRQEIKT